MLFNQDWSLQPELVFASATYNKAQNYAVDVKRQIVWLFNHIG